MNTLNTRVYVGDRVAGLFTGYTQAKQYADKLEAKGYKTSITS